MVAARGAAIAVKIGARLRKQYFVLALACLLAGMGVVAYRGPASAWVRFYMVDVLGVACMYFGLSGLWYGPVLARAGVPLAIAVAIEIAQWLQWTPKQAPWLIRFILGASFDWGDLLAYAIGLVGALAIERWWLLRGRSAEFGKTIDKSS